MQSELDRAAGRPRAASNARTKKRLGDLNGNGRGSRASADGRAEPEPGRQSRHARRHSSQLARYSTFFVAVCLRVYSGLLTRFVFLPTRRDSRVKQRPTPCEAAPDSFDGVLVTRESAEEREARCSPPGL